MTREAFLTARWNNLLSVVGGLAILAYIAVVSFTPILSPSGAFIGLVIIRVLY